MNAALTPIHFGVSAMHPSGRRPRHLRVVRPTTRTTREWSSAVPAVHDEGGSVDPFHGTSAPVPWGRVRRTSPVVYRRRRLAAALVVILVAFVAGAVFSVVALSTPAGGTLTPAAEEAQRVRYVVEQGDTLWGVAEAVAPGENRREVVDAIAEHRGTSTLVPGDVIVWPLPGD